MIFTFFTYLISKEPELALLTVERRPIVDHFRMNFHFVNKLHVISKLLEVPNVAITDFTNDKIVFASST